MGRYEDPELYGFSGGSIDQVPVIRHTTPRYTTNVDYDINALPIGVGIGAGVGQIGFDPMLPASQPSVLPAVVPAVGALATIPGAGVIGTVGAVLGGLYGVAQALGLGEGGGILGNDLLGGGNGKEMGGVEFGGPGLAEPDARKVIKEWHVNYDWGRLQYYLVQVSERSRKIFLYNTKTKKWKWWTWRKPHLAVIGKNMPSHKQITRLRRNLSRHRADADTILKMVSPAYQEYKASKRKRSRR